jgi:putative addiction module killer protein
MILFSAVWGTAGRYRVEEYVTSDGLCPFMKWLDSLQPRIQARIQARVARFRMGNLGDVKMLGKGVYEARFHFGPGYRIYFGLSGKALVVLLCGGDKSSQQDDVRGAIEYWQDYLERSDS